MNSVERVLSALKLQIPDKVPFMFADIDKTIREKLLGEKITYQYNYSKAEWSPVFGLGERAMMEPYECTDARVARLLGLDAIGMQYMTPIFADVAQSDDGTVYIKKSLLTSAEALKTIKMPDVDDERIYRPAREFIKTNKGEFALYCRIRLGVSPTSLSMGIEEFSYNVVDDPDFVHEVVAMYTGWVSKLITNLIEVGFDFLWSFDDMAYKSGPMFSPRIWDEFFFPNLKKAADHITIPWIFHSDGNLMPIMDKLLPLGMNGLHPLEPGAMDLGELKQKYGKKVCLVGNLDIDSTLSKSSLEEVDEEVKNKIELLGPGGGYIISDSNSVPANCNPENLKAVAKAVEKYRYIYSKA
jgi:uroporphyrinogen decarboxylase